MQIKGLYYSNKLKQYFWLGDRSCHYCGLEVNNIIFVHKAWGEKVKVNERACDVCSKKFFNQGTVNSYVLALVTDSPPSDSFPVFGGMSLSDHRGTTVFEAATLNSEFVTDKTRLSRYSLSSDEEAVGYIGNPDRDLLRESGFFTGLFNPMSEANGIKFLEKLRDSKPILTEREKKLLEEESEARL